MTRIPDDVARRLVGFPPELLALLEAELAAGNEIVEVASCFPAPPAGVYVKLARPVTTRPRQDAAGIRFFDRRSSLYSGEFSDERRFHFVLEPPQEPLPAAPAAEPADDAVARFESSMRIDYERWHDGIGYDLDVLRAASPEERTRIEQLLLAGGVNGWRDVEALAALGTPGAEAALRRALAGGSHEVRMAVMSHAPALAAGAEGTRTLVAALRGADFYGGLTQALDAVVAHHPPEVMDALFRGLLARPGEVAVHFAAMLVHLHGQAPEPFDWSQRPFFLRFSTEDRREREAAFRELCTRLGVDADSYLKS